MSFDCTIQRHDGTVTVVPEGDISLETTSVMREVLRQVVESDTGDEIDVDMSAVTFLDSSGIGMLVAAQRAAAARGKTLMLSEPGPMTTMVLQIANLQDILVKAPAAG
jgi:anti-anti-sigma factor